MGPSAFRLDQPARSARDRKREWEEYARTTIGRRIRFLEPPEVTAYWIQKEIELDGKASWHPQYGMTGTIIAVPEMDVIGAGPQVRWDDGHETWLGSLSQWEYLDK